MTIPLAFEVLNNLRLFFKCHDLLVVMVCDLINLEFTSWWDERLFAIDSERNLMGGNKFVIDVSRNCHHSLVRPSGGVLK